MQSISLVNRLIAVSAHINESSLIQISQSALYLNLIKYINQKQSIVTESAFESQKALADININQNNQFIMQLNIMMSKTCSSTSYKSAFGDKNEINWFYLLTKIAIHKSNRTLDCLLFSLFKKISQLTPLLFGSLLGPYANKIHLVLLDKLNSANDGQIITIVCELLCSLIENQPAFFQKLADMTIEKVLKLNDAAANENSEDKVIVGDRSVLKAIFKLLTDLKKVTLCFVFPDYITGGA